MSGSRVAGRVARSTPFQAVARGGLAVYGVLHLLVAWLALQVAVGDLDGDGVGKADKTGALQSLTAGSGGTWLLWLICVALGATTLWQLLEATSKHGSHRLVSLAEAVLFGYLSFSAGKIAAGSPASSTDTAQLGFVGWLLSKEWGKPVVIVIGAAIIVVALLIARHGLTKRFTHEHDYRGASGATRDAVIRLGQAGYLGLGAVYGIAGALVIVAAVQSAPSKATGLDVALKTLAAQSWGSVVLILIAAGLAAFGVFTLADARYRRQA